MSITQLAAQPFVELIVRWLRAVPTKAPRTNVCVQRVRVAGAAVEGVKVLLRALHSVVLPVQVPWLSVPLPVMEISGNQGPPLKLSPIQRTDTVLRDKVI